LAVASAVAWCHKNDAGTLLDARCSMLFDGFDSRCSQRSQRYVTLSTLKTTCKTTRIAQNALRAAQHCSTLLDASILLNASNALNALNAAWRF
jgi:hypothetical protein